MQDLAALLNKANQSFKAGDLDAAASLYRQTLDFDAGNPSVLTALGTIYLTKGNYQEAVLWLKQALVFVPDSVVVNSNLGFVLLQTGKYSDAARYLIAALEKEPGQAYLWNDLGEAMYKSGQIDAAAECFQKAIKIDPNFTAGYLALGEIAAKKENSVQEAINYFHKVLVLDENNWKAHYELSRIHYLKTCRLEQAIHHAKRALAINPRFAEAEVTLAELLLKQGKLTEGFALFDQSRHLYIDKQSGRYKFFQMIPRWQGEIFSGKRLIIGEDGGFGGFGDLMMFARYIPLVKQRGGRVALPVKKQLYRLFQTLGGVDEFLLPSEDPIRPEDFNLQIPFVSLPTIFGTSLKTIPPAPYLAADPELTAIWKKKVDDANNPPTNLKVGLTWACNSHKEGMPEHRTCDFKALEPLFQLPQVTYYNLQVGEAAEEIAARNAAGIIDLTGHIEDFADTAAFINNLDLVISVDTAVAHLTGAIGKPVWLLLHFVSDWKWFTGRSDSPWYPSMRLFRSQTPDDWRGVVKEVCEQLQKAVQNRELLCR